MTASEAGRGIQSLGIEESQLLTLTNRYEVLATCVDKEEGCREDALTDRGTVVQEAIQEGGAKRQVVVVGDSIIRGIDSILCKPDQESRMVCCLPGARVRDISDRLERILEREGDDPVVVVHVGTNNIGKTRKENLFGDYQALGTKLKTGPRRL